MLEQENDREKIDVTANNVRDVRLDKYRWLILIVYCCFSACNFGQFLQYSIISNIIQKYYSVSSPLVDLTGLVFQIVYLLGFIPASFIIEKYNLRLVSIFATGATALGNLLKLLSVEQDRFYIVLIGQSLCALGQVFLMSIPSKVASTWFGANEVSTACAIAVLGTQLGVAIGCIVSPLLVYNHDDLNLIQSDLFRLLIINASISVGIFILTLLVFKSEPKFPPSQSQVNLVDRIETFGTFLTSFKEIFRKKDFIILLFAFGISNGSWNAFGLLFNEIYITYFPKSEQEAGIIALLAIISGGCIGSVVFGLILDKTHKFKLIAFVVLFAAASSFIVVIAVLEAKVKVATFIVIPIFGFFLASTLAIGFEFVLEVTYPIAESTSCSILNATIFLFSLIFTYMFEAFFHLFGFLKTDITVSVILFLCSFLIYFVSNNLHRRDANSVIN